MTPQRAVEERVGTTQPNADRFDTTQSIDLCCKECGAQLAVAAGLRTTTCPYCDAPSVIERPPSADRPRPAFVVGFVLDRQRATQCVRRWLKSRGPFAGSGLKKASLEKVRGVYVPAYLYNAVALIYYCRNSLRAAKNSDFGCGLPAALGSYRAEIGENYTETETYTTTDAQGKTVTRTRVVTRTEHRSLSGNHATYVIDVVVTASRGVSNAELEAIEPFDMRALRRYDAALLSGWLAEEPSLSQEECLALAHEESVERIGRELASFMPGDSHHDLRYRTELRDRIVDLVLLPVWVFAARYRKEKPPVRILVNGLSGKAAGRVPLSWIKILAAALAAVGLIAGILLLALR